MQRQRTGWSRTLSPRTSMRSRPTPAAVAGRGTPARRGGSIGSSWERWSGSRSLGANSPPRPWRPPGWKPYKIHYRWRETTYHIAVGPGEAGNGGPGVVVDGVEQADGVIQLVDDRRDHQVEVRISAAVISASYR